jgi:5'-nucleotidase
VHRWFAAENRVATAIKARLKDPSIVLSPKEKKRLDAHFLDAASLVQKEAVETALASPFAIITGGPGTGKTTTILKLIDLFVAHHGEGVRIALCAPTGKAVSRMDESLRGQISALKNPELQRVFAFESGSPVEVLLLSRSDPETGLRVFNSITQHGLDITRAAFTPGKSAFPYLSAFNASLFLSANEQDVRDAVASGFPAGIVLDSDVTDDSDDDELRIAFDFDGILADDESEQIYKAHGLAAFQEYETDKAHVPHTPRLFHDLFQKLSYFQQLELEQIKEDPSFKRSLRIAIITARSAPRHERVVTTLKEWGVMPDETFFFGGINKRKVLEILKPHIFFDDQIDHLKESSQFVPSVHVPFGQLNSQFREDER